MKVSVWTGKIRSWDILDAQLTFAFSDDGDAIPSIFCEAFGIDWFDDDYREASHLDTMTHNVDELLFRHSQGEQIAEALGNRKFLTATCNAIVLLYEFEYSGAVKTVSVSEDAVYYFTGCVDIR